MRILLTTLAFSALSFSANAQVVVYGSGLGRQCYEAAETSRMTARAAIGVCTNALTEGTMTRQDRVSTLVNRGILYMREGEFETAMADYNQALEMDPDNAEAFLNMGAAYIYEQDYAPAIEVLDRAIELEANHLWAAYYNRGIAHEQSGDLTSGYWDFVRSQELNPDSPLPARQIERFTVEELPVEPDV